MSNVILFSNIYLGKLLPIDVFFDGWIPELGVALIDTKILSLLLDLDIFFSQDEFSNALKRSTR